MKLIIVGLFLVFSKFAFADSCSTYGNTANCDDGTSYSRYGNTTYGSDGSTYTRYGNTTYGSDGSTNTINRIPISGTSPAI